MIDLVRRRTLAWIVGVSLLAVACGGPAVAPTLDGRVFLSTSVTQDGADRPLVPGTRIRLGFGDGGLTASVGCNTMGGTVRLDGGVLVLDGGAMTEMGCDEARHAQDSWLFDILGGRPTVRLAGNELEIQSGETVIRLLDREVAEPDLEPIGTLWTVDSIISGDAVSSVPAGVTATLRLLPGGDLALDTGCNTGSGHFVIDGATIRFSDIGLTKRACDGPAGAMEGAVLAVVAADAVSWSIDANSLTLGAGSAGLILRGG
ncbi:MAG TPA: META domain-containing protein [Candidatus Limnocylindrales bacterium]|nr:META domain-containing protein [Candidatus Limnocylindrales bacterium]